MYEEARKYYYNHGNLAVPQKYVTPSGAKLGFWIDEQRKEYRAGKLSEKEIYKLREIGFIFNEEEQRTYPKRISLFEVIILYYIKKVFPDAIKLYISDWLGIELDVYIPSLKVGIEYDSYHYHEDLIERDECKGRICSENGVTLIRIRDKRLDDIENCDKKYTLNPNNYVLELAAIIENIIRDLNGTIMKCNIIKDFDDIIILRDEYDAIRWIQVYTKLFDTINHKGVEYIYNHNVDSENYINYKKWICKQNKVNDNDMLSVVQFILLERLGIFWGRGKKLKWIRKYMLSIEHCVRQGYYELPARQRNEGFLIGAWLGRQCVKKKKGKLSSEKIRLLNALTMKSNWR